MTGWVTDIVRGSFHDGPGIRTVVFLQGCSLRCLWCHNPETWSMKPVPLFYPDRCLRCGACRDLAERADCCSFGARFFSSTEKTVEDVMAVIRQDRVFYSTTGGVTFSGGEPCCQPDFLLALLKQCHAEAIPTAIETNLNYPVELLEAMLPFLTVLIADLKLVDIERHRGVTGFSNEAILKNFSGLQTAMLPIIVRTPLMAHVNDDDANIEKSIEILQPLKTLVYYELLRYQPMGLEKRRALRWTCPTFEMPSKERMKGLCQKICDAGIPLYVDGKKV